MLTISVACVLWRLQTHKVAKNRREVLLKRIDRKTRANILNCKLPENATLPPEMHFFGFKPEECKCIRRKVGKISE